MCFLVFKIPDDGQSRNPNNSKETYTWSMFLIPVSLKKLYLPAGLVPLLSHLTYCTPTKFKLCFDSSLKTFIRKPALTVHAPDPMSTFLSFGLYQKNLSRSEAL
jgi:hypothetical protein